MSSEAQGRAYEVAIDLLTHTGKTKYYTLITLRDKRTNAAAGLQIWGPNGKHTGKKIISGTADEVSTAQGLKRAEKEKPKNGESYQCALSTRDTFYGASAALSIIKRYITPDAESLAKTLMGALGDGLVSVAEEQQAEEAAAKREKVASLNKNRQVAYSSSWGSF